MFDTHYYKDLLNLSGYYDLNKNELIIKKFIKYVIKTYNISKCISIANISLLTKLNMFDINEYENNECNNEYEINDEFFALMKSKFICKYNFIESFENFHELFPYLEQK